MYIEYHSSLSFSLYNFSFHFCFICFLWVNSMFVTICESVLYYCIYIHIIQMEAQYYMHVFLIPCYPMSVAVSSDNKFYLFLNIFKTINKLDLNFCIVSRISFLNKTYIELTSNCI